MGTLKKQAMEIFNILRLENSYVFNGSINDFENMYIILKKISAYKKVKIIANFPIFSLNNKEETVKVEVEMSAEEISKIADEAHVNQCSIKDYINKKLS